MSRGFRNRQSPKAEVKSVDLGLNFLVNGSPDAASEDVIPEVTQASAEPAVTSESQFASLAQSERWEELSAFCESRFAEDNSTDLLYGAEAKLWWIKSQSKLKSVPQSILEAPYDSVKRTLSGFSDSDPRLSSLLALSLEVEKELKPAPESISTKTFNETEAINKYERSERRIKLFVGAFLFGLLVVGFFLLRTSESSESVALVLPTEEQQPQMLVPEPERISRVSHLDAVFYDIDTAPGIDTKIKFDPARTETKTTQEVRPKEREVIDTSGPIEAPEAREARRQPEIVRERIPGAPPETEQYDGSRLFGTAPQASGTDWDRPRFEQYGGGKTFTVLAKTKVMPRASTQGVPVGELKAGDIVTSESREGYWLKIRSTQGRFGFILAQDVDGSGR